jgi:hypothetical protein
LGLRAAGLVAAGFGLVVALGAPLTVPVLAGLGGLGFGEGVAA